MAASRLLRLPPRPALLGGAAASVGVAAAYFLWSRRLRAYTSCCPPGSLPPLSSLSPGDAPESGSEQEVASLTTYVTGTQLASSPAERVVVVLTDVWGFRAGRHRQVCDVLASSLRCSVYMPDLFHGDSLTVDKSPGTAGFAPWVQQWSPSRVSADIERLLDTFPAACKVGVVGFCWGTFAALLAGSGSSTAVKAACFAHPSHRAVMEKMHGIAPHDVGEYYLGSFRAPTLCLTAGNDDPRCKPGGTDEKILQLAGVPTKFAEFENQSHGWIVKGELSNPETAAAVRSGVGLIRSWLDEHL